MMRKVQVWFRRGTEPRQRRALRQWSDLSRTDVPDVWERIVRERRRREASDAGSDRGNDVIPMPSFRTPRWRPVAAAAALVVFSALGARLLIGPLPWLTRPAATTAAAQPSVTARQSYDRLLDVMLVAEGEGIRFDNLAWNSTLQEVLTHSGLTESDLSPLPEAGRYVRTQPVRFADPEASGIMSYSFTRDSDALRLTQGIVEFEVPVGDELRRFFRAVEEQMQELARRPEFADKNGNTIAQYFGTSQDTVLVQDGRPLWTRYAIYAPDSEERVEFMLSGADGRPLETTERYRIRIVVTTVSPGRQ